MQFYKVSGCIKDRALIEENNDKLLSKKNVRSIMIKSKEYNRKLNGKAFFSFVRMDEDLVTVCAISDCCTSKKNRGMSFDKMLAGYTEYVGCGLTDIMAEEVIFGNFSDMISCASREGYIEDEDEVFEQFKLSRLNSRWAHMNYGENIIKQRTRKEIEHISEKYLAGESMLPEIDRIFQESDKTKPLGHPVHYIIETDDNDIRRELYQALLSALYANGRVNNRRYCYVNIESREDFSNSLYEALYNSGQGGTMVVRFAPSPESEEDDYASTDKEILQLIGETAFKYRNQVLTIICLPRECAKLNESLFEEMGNLCYIELKENYVKGEAAKKYLKMLASERSIKTDKKLFELIEEDHGYLSNDLNELFNSWFDTKLRTNIYPQYKEAKKIKKELQKASPKGSAYDRLNEMIGLSAAKEVINSALDFYKAQKLYKDMGVKEDHPSMHLVFTGNPGTAKTTVARLFAEIMKDNGILSTGRMIECGRSDLVGKYVGWTAVQVKNKFKEASGGVLFIDEAYSLCDDRSGSFGDEAINTIVQEMENHREDVVCIFAGYPDKMEGFLNKNPGLRSRIAFHVQFDDYSSEELCDITKLIAKQKGLAIEDEALEKLRYMYDDMKKESDFGNGRAARNVVEKARMKQASRLVKIDFDRVTKSDVTTIKAEDIAAFEPKRKPEKNIGFCA